MRWIEVVHGRESIFTRLVYMQRYILKWSVTQIFYIWHHLAHLLLDPFLDPLRVHHIVPVLYTAYSVTDAANHSNCNGAMTQVLADIVRVMQVLMHVPDMPLRHTKEYVQHQKRIFKLIDLAWKHLNLSSR